MDLVELPTAHNRHPWELSRFDYFSKIIQSTFANSGIHVLDVGSGDAWFSNNLIQRLPAGSNIQCWDANYENSHLESIGPGLHKNVSLTKNQPRQKFDLVMMLDVLEHIDRDTDFLTKIAAENMHPNAYALISVPAWQSLYSQHDKALKHFRRYSPGQIRGVIETSGLKIEHSSGLYTSLLLARSLEKAFAFLRPGRQNHSISGYKGGPFITKMARTALNMDGVLNRVLSHIKVDFLGLSWWALCRKQS